MRKHYEYRRRILQKLYPYALGTKKELIIMTVSSFFVMLIGLIPPFLYRIFIDNVLIQKEITHISYVFVGLILTFLIKALLGAVNTKSKNRVSKELTWKIKKAILSKYLSDDKYLESKPGELKKVIENDVMFMADFIETQACDYYTGILSVLFLNFILFCISWKIALLSVLFIPVTYGIDYILAKKENRIEEYVRYLESGRYQFVLESLNNWKEIKTLGLGRRLLREYVRWLTKWAKFNMTYVNHAVLKGTIFPKIKELLLGRVFIYVIGSFLVLKGELTIGGLLVFAQYYYDALCNIEAFSKLEFSIEENKVHYDKVLEFLGQDAEKKKYILNAPIKEICFENVGFQYSKDMSFQLHNVSFKLKEGEKAAIVGESGSGKTTIAKLLLNQYQAKSGTIWINGIDIEKLDENDFHRRIGIVFQDSKLVNMSVRDNILLGNPNAGDEEIKRACQKADILKDIEYLENGLDTIVGENGMKFSGGQRQRIILARVFLQNPDVYILDEATASLDSTAENSINRVIENIENKIVLVIAHRASAVQLCDKVYTVKDGILAR